MPNFFSCQLVDLSLFSVLQNLCILAAFPKFLPNILSICSFLCLPIILHIMVKIDQEIPNGQFSKIRTL